MGLAWQQGPLAQASVGRFISPTPLPERLLFSEPLRRRMRVAFGGRWIADSEDVRLLHEPARYPTAYFPLSDVTGAVLEREERVTRHQDLGPTAWFSARSGDRVASHAAWQPTDPPAYASEFAGRIAFAWRAMDAFYEEDERIVGHAADLYHRNDVRRTSRHLVVTDGAEVVADSVRPLALYESGFAPRWYVPPADVQWSRLQSVDGQTFCPYKGLASYYDVGEHRRAAWSYRQAWPEAHAVTGYVSFQPELIDVYLDGRKVALEPGQAVIAHGLDRGLDPDELARVPGGAPMVPGEAAR